MGSRTLELNSLDESFLPDETKQFLAAQRAELAERIGPAGDVESHLDALEAHNRDLWVAQLERSKKGFREGRFTTWEEVKRQNGL